MKSDDIKYLAYTANVMQTAIYKGYKNDGYETIQQKLNAFMAERNITQADIYAFFGQHEYVDQELLNDADDPTPKEVFDKLSSDAWRALEYFKII